MIVSNSVWLPTTIWMLKGDEDEFSVEGEARYAIESTMDVGLALSPADDGDTITVSFRAYF